MNVGIVKLFRGRGSDYACAQLELAHARFWRASLAASSCVKKMEGSMKSLRRTFTGEEDKETDYVRQVSVVVGGHVP